jgi:TetR/AcrR family tetracycline transcriptional repressor
MRSLAEVLTVTPSALYWHFPTKEQLIGEVSALVLADIEVSDDHEQAWDVWLAALAHGMRAAMHRHPNLASVVGGQMLTTERGVPLAERIFRVLAAAGFSGRELIDVFNTYVGCGPGLVDDGTVGPA